LASQPFFVAGAGTHAGAHVGARVDANVRAGAGTDTGAGGRLVPGLSDELLKNVFFYHIPTDSSWARDIGPIFVREVESGDAGDGGRAGVCAGDRDAKGKLVITDWVFNAWGNKYGPYAQDDVVPQRVGKLLGLTVLQPGIVLEGGSIDVNGRGTLLTTEQCLLNKNRNPSLTRAQIEKFLNDYLGARHVLWLKEGIVGDDTDGHIDDVARFVSADTVVCAVETNKQDENYQILQACCNDLLKMKDQDGNPLKVVKLPMPLPVVHNGQRLPASYANFLITNKSVLVPTFRCERDGEALAVLAKCFPGRKIVGIDCWDLVWGLGTIHCSTQQQPVSVRPGVR
jgi:agmatine deiminase